MATQAGPLHLGDCPGRVISVAGGALRRLGARLQRRPVLAGLIALALGRMAAPTECHHLRTGRHPVWRGMPCRQAMLFAASVAGSTGHPLAKVCVFLNVAGRLGMALLAKLMNSLSPGQKPHE